MLFSILLIQFSAIHNILTTNEFMEGTRINYKTTQDSVEYISWEFSEPNKIVYIPYSDPDPLYCEVYQNNSVIDAFDWNGQPIYYEILSTLGVGLHNFTFSLYNKGGDEATYTAMITIKPSEFERDNVKKDDYLIYLIIIVVFSGIGIVGYNHYSNKVEKVDPITKGKESAAKTKKGLNDIQKIISKKQNKLDKADSSADKTRKFKRR